MIRKIDKEDIPKILELGKNIGFEQTELEVLHGDIAAFFEKDNHSRWISYSQNDTLIGAAYYRPEKMTDRTWNILFIAVDPEHQKQGVGSKLLNYIKQDLQELNQRLIIVETSNLPEFKSARNFYDKNTFKQQGIIQDFYQKNDDKIVYSHNIEG